MTSASRLVLTLALCLLAGRPALATEVRQLEMAATIEELMEAERIYTLVNLHPNEASARLSANNLQAASLIPLCTEVELSDLNDRSVRVRLVERGLEYQYTAGRFLTDPFEKHLRHVFGTACPKPIVEVLPARDQEGIRQGRPLVGMTKTGVVFAIGFPPQKMTPDPASLEWKYLKNRYDDLTLHFDEAGWLVRIED